MEISLENLYLNIGAWRVKFSFFFLQLLESTNKEKNEALQRKAASLEDQLKGQKVKESSRSFFSFSSFFETRCLIEVLLKRAISLCSWLAVPVTFISLCSSERSTSTSTLFE